jgi:hypothetical protein
MELEFLFLKEATYFQNCLGYDFKFSSTDFNHLIIIIIIIIIIMALYC